MRPSPPPHSQDPAITASEVAGLLAVLWGRAQVKVPTGAISPSQLRALLVIERLEGSNLRTLGEALGSGPPATSRLCDRLEAAGLLERRLSTASRREVELYLSRPGRVLLDEVRDRQVDEVRPVLEAMSPEDYVHLVKGLTAFRDAAAAGVEGAAVTAPDMPVARPA